MNIMRDDTQVEVQLDGDLVSTATDRVREELKKVLGEKVTELTLNMSDVTVVDSVGLGLVIALHNSLVKVGGTIKVKNVSRDIMELFRSMRLDRHFSVASV
jgi:anti-sigma B factor antagonist